MTSPVMEIATFAEQPHKMFSNHQAMDFVIAGGTETRPDTNCPDNIYEIMKRCWIFDPVERISFTKIIASLIDEAPASFYERSFYCLKD